MSKARIERSAGGVVVRRIDGDVHALLIRDPYHNWGLPKGHVEEGEGAAEAALREVTEETGLADLVLGPELDTIDWYFRLQGRLVHKFCSFYLMGSPDGETVPEVEEGITECVWLPVGEALDTITYDNARAVLARAQSLLESSDDDSLPL